MMTNTALLPSRPPRPSIWANSHWSLGRPSKECINVRHQLLPHQCIQWSWCQAGHIPCRHTLCWSEACSSWKCKAENILEKIHKMQFELLLPCSQCMHHPVLLFPCIVTAEFLNVGRSKVLKVQRSGSPLSPRCCTWNARRFEYSLGHSLQFLPRISAVSFRNTKICILRLPLLSARRGKIHEHALSMFLSKFVISDMILFKHIMLTLSLYHANGSPNVHFPRNSSTLLEDVWSVTAAWQHKHLIFVNA